MTSYHAFKTVRATRPAAMAKTVKVTPADGLARRKAAGRSHLMRDRRRGYGRLR